MVSKEEWRYKCRTQDCKYQFWLQYIPKDLTIIPKCSECNKLCQRVDLIQTQEVLDKIT